jgi:hypothetical protein
VTVAQLSAWTKQEGTMSFIITTVSPETVVQVSDTRHSSLTNQSSLDEDLRKTLIVRGKKAHFVLGWIGLASTDDHHRHNTADWLFKTLYEMNAVELTIEDIAELLQTSATAHFENLHALDKRSLFVMAGWQESEPFLCTVSNYTFPNATEENHAGPQHHVPSFSEAAVAAPAFRGWTQRFRNLKEQDYLVMVMGDFDRGKLKGHLRGLESVLKKRADAKNISGACRQIALEAAAHRKTIGTNLIGAEMDKTGHAYCSFYSENGAETILVPDILSPEASSTQGTLRTVVSGPDVTVRVEAKIAVKKAG